MPSYSINASYLDVVSNVWTNFKQNHPWNTYASILALSAYERIGKFEKNDAIIEECVAVSRRFLNGEFLKFGGAYGKYVYHVGGAATAWLFARGYIPEAKDKLIAAAEMLIKEFPRSPEGAYRFPDRPELVWIDTLFAVCPFLVWLGESVDRQDFVDEAIDQLVIHHKMLFDPETKLYFQARREGKLSARWGRGVGWAVYALAEMTYDLRNHARFEEVASIYRDLIDGCLAAQDENGLFHQVINDHSTYAESSSTGLILYGFGRAIKNRIVPREKVYEPFLRGIRGLSRFVGLDGTVSDCCCGCLYPGDGTEEDYAKHPKESGEVHSAGPILCAFGQAEQLYYNNLIPSYADLMADKEYTMPQ